ncbi:MAG: RNA polymerase subunit sigma-70 [Oscillospiraceae bacterium]|jgi:formylmethanofuran dehydrogenase subunit E|nr:RNA polymerase subunit sigma-70 [Oscillospiraceae bacterium]
MTETQKQRISELLRQGVSRPDIADAVGVSLNTLKAYCYRHRDETAAPAAPQARHGFCLHCGEVVVQAPRRKPKKFCSAKCRALWWNHNRMSAEKGVLAMRCANCGDPFMKRVGSPKRFCCHACYIRSRFGEVSGHG